MSSDNYRISTTVVSGGGGPMGSANYQMNSTFGQPTPIMEQGMDPYSDNYGLLPGFWHTVGSTTPFSACPADFEPDGDVDDDDLAVLAADFGQTSVIKDTDSDLDMDGKDLWEMVVDFGRNDCMP